MGVSPMLKTALVGRANVVELVRQALERTQAGQGATLLVGGEAGIGKSRLTQEAARLAEARGFQFLRGSCFPNDLQCPFAPILDLLREQLSHDAPGDRAFLVKERLTLLPELFAEAEAAPLASNVEMEKRRLFSVLAAYFERRTRAAPVLCVIEDLHWCDDASLDFLHHLARRAPALPLLIVATYRNDEMAPALVEWLAQVERARLAREIVLERMSRAEVETLMTTILEPSAPLRHDFVVNVHALTDGNPFFVEETLKSMPVGAASGALLDVGALRTVQAMVQARFATLGRESRTLAMTAAVIGREFDFAFLQALSGQPEDALIEELHILIDAMLIEERAPDRFAFRHALTRQAIYALLLGRERREMHRRAGAIIEQMYAGALEAFVFDLAYHFGEAGEREKVFRYAALAGEQALLRSLPSAAVAQLTLAIDSARELRQETPRGLLVQRARAHEMVGDFDGARVDLEAALADARSAADRHGEWEALVALGFLWSARDYAQAGKYYRQALSRAKAMKEPRALARSLNQMGNWYANAERHEEAEDHHDQAMAIYEKLKDERGITETHDLFAIASFLAGEAFRATSFTDEAIARYEATGDHAGLVSCLGVATLQGINGQTELLALPIRAADESAAGAERAIRIAAESGMRSGEAFATGALALLLDGQGEHGRALTLARNTLAIALETGHRQWTIYARFCLGLALANVLALKEARNELEQALTLATECNAIFWQLMVSGSLASVLVEMGEVGLVMHTFSDYFNLDFVPRSVAQRQSWRAYAELQLATGRAEEAYQYALRLEAATIDSKKAPGYVVPRVHLLMAQAAVAAGRLAEAEELIAPVKRNLVERGARPLLWRLLLVEADVLGKRRNEVGRRAALLEARSLAERLAQTIASSESTAPAEDVALREHFLSELERRIPIREGGARLAAKEERGGLTAREFEIAEWVAKGASNREISQALVLSERTVETHLSNVYAILGLRGRAQLTAWMLARQES